MATGEHGDKILLPQAEILPLLVCNMLLLDAVYVIM